MRQLMLAGLFDDALREVQFAQRTWGDSPALQGTSAWIRAQQAQELRADERFSALRGSITTMRRAYPQFLSAEGAHLPIEILRNHLSARLLGPDREVLEGEWPRPLLLSALMAQESTFTADIRSSANARGLMQVMPGTGRLYARKLGIRPFTTASLSRPETNVQDRRSVLQGSRRPVRRRSTTRSRAITPGTVGSLNGSRRRRVWRPTSSSTASRFPRHRTTSNGFSGRPKTIAGSMAPGCSPPTAGRSSIDERSARADESRRDDSLLVSRVPRVRHSGYSRSHRRPPRPPNHRLRLRNWTQRPVAESVWPGRRLRSEPGRCRHDACVGRSRRARRRRTRTVYLRHLRYRHVIRRHAMPRAGCSRRPGDGADGSSRRRRGDHDGRARDASRRSLRVVAGGPALYARHGQSAHAQAGLRVERVSFLFGSLFPLMLSVRFVQRLLRPFRAHRPDSDIAVPPAPVNGLLTALVLAEARMARHVSVAGRKFVAGGRQKARSVRTAGPKTLAR